MDTVLPADEAPVMPARAAPTQAAPQPEREFFEEPAEGLNGALVVTGGPPPTSPARPLRRFLPARMGDALWKSATIFSLLVNLVLVVGLLIVSTQLFEIKNSLLQPLVGGLYDNFVLMHRSHIVTTIQVNDTIHVNDIIQVNDTIPVVFDVPLQTNTIVTLTQDTAIPQTTVYLNGIGIPTDIVLPAGTPLRIALTLIVPVSQTVPVVLDVPINLEVPVNLVVPVDIALDQTDLHRPFTNLANLVGPYNALIEQLPSSWDALFRPD